MQDPSILKRRNERNKMVVLNFDDFKQNCYLLETSLGNDSIDPTTNLNNLRTWVQWIHTGHGTNKHENYFYYYSLPKIVSGLLKRKLVRN